MDSHTLDIVAESLTADNRCQAVMLCGISGSGKTHLANILEQKGWFRISIDHLTRQMYGKAFDDLPTETQKTITEDAEKEIAQRMTTQIAAGHRVVADGCLCKRSKRDFIRDILLKHGIHPTLVYLKASFEDSLIRINKRNGLSPDEIIVSEDMLKHFFANFQAPDPTEKAIVINT